MFEPVQISRSEHQGASETGDDRRWALEGFDLRSALARVCDIPDTRIDLPASLDTADRYDFVATVALGQPYEARRRVMRHGIERHFDVRITEETRPMDVYVMTAPHGGGPALRLVDERSEGGGIGSCGVSFAMPEVDGKPVDPENLDAVRERFSTLVAMRQAALGAPISGLNAWSSSIDDVCGMLERHFGRPVVNESHLAGRYDLQIEDFLPNTEEFLARLGAQAGLVLTRGRRDVRMLIVKPVWQ